jgi:hypothetical protein
MPKSTTTTTAPASLEARLDAICDAIKQVIPELDSAMRDALKLGDAVRHARLHRYHRTLHDAASVAAEARI